MGQVAVTLECSHERTVDLLFEAGGSGGGVSLSVDRTRAVTCVPVEPTVTDTGPNESTRVGAPETLR